MYFDKQVYIVLHAFLYFGILVQYYGPSSKSSTDCQAEPAQPDRATAYKQSLKLANTLSSLDNV